MREGSETERHFQRTIKPERLGLCSARLFTLRAHPASAGRAWVETCVATDFHRAKIERVLFGKKLEVAIQASACGGYREPNVR